MTPLSARWAQMDQQRRELERRKQLYLQRNRNPPEPARSSSEAPGPGSLNAFSNDGSFLDKFRQLSGSKAASVPNKSSRLPHRRNIAEKRSGSGESSRPRRDRSERELSGSRRSRDRSGSSSRDKEQQPGGRDGKFSRDKNNYRDHKYNRWKSSNHNSRRRSFSPCTPVVEDMPHRKPSRFANILPANISKSFAGSNVSDVNGSNNGFQNHPQINLPVFPDRVMNNPTIKPINLNLPLLTNSIINTQIPPPVNVPPPNVLPVANNSIMPPNVNQNSVRFPNYTDNVPVNIPYLPPNNPNQIFSIVNSAIPPPVMNDGLARLPLPIMNPMTENIIPHIPLHAIPEPKPIDTVSIPPPKPLDTIAIPPPKPLDTVTIPPPKPMNLHSIPPPSPICLTQIPKPKELDLCSIPHPPVSVLSTDGCLSTAMEATAKQVAQIGDAWEHTLKTQNAKADPWFLRDTKSTSVLMLEKNTNNLPSASVYTKDIPNDDKYEPEFSLRDESSSDEEKEDNTYVKDNMSYAVSYPIKLHFEKNKNEQKDLSTLTADKFKNDLNNDSDSDQSPKAKKKELKKKKSRWGDTSAQPTVGNIGLPGVAAVTSLGGVININQVPTFPPKLQPNLTKITRQDPGLVQYAIKTYGSVNLTEEDWKKCEDHYKISILYQEMLTKRREIEKLTASGRFKYEYDSDEEIDENGTWEHRLRQQEMEATQRWASELTRQANGKHHIGDFLPPDELKKFMEKYSSVKDGKEPDLSDYKEYKLKEDNIGFKMLQKLGWSEGEGLGADRSGIVDPVNKATQRDSNHGLGVERVDNLTEEDDEFDAYRKRMMLAYRFRPNPLNNPRRPYY